MAQKKDSGNETLKELEKLLVEDLHERRSSRHRRQRIWFSIGVRLSVYLVLILICYFVRIFATLKLALAIFLFFVMLEAFRYYQWDQKILKVFRRRRK